MGRYIKCICIGIVIFFGSGFSIMAFHNDVGIVDLFAQIYEQVIGRAPEGIGGLEIGYSIGLAGGILIFFNHFNLKKRENDPTPLQVEVSKYEQDVEDTVARIRKKEQQGAAQDSGQSGAQDNGQSAVPDRIEGAGSVKEDTEERQG